jgi:DNA/RNA-binding domain of Phe-tRNA-synthetase-like protein
LHIGVLAVRGMNNRGPDESILQLVRERQRKIREEFAADMLSQHPRIGSWRNAYSSFGAKPKKHNSSVEGLYRMTLKGIDLRHINKVVDVYNFISLKHMVPVGGDDASRVEGDILLTVAKGDEPFKPLHAEVEETVRKGEIIYRDDREVLCRRWNWRECDKTKMTESTTEVVLVVEGLPPVGKEDIEVILLDLKGLVMKSCGGSSASAVLDRDCTSLLV